MPTCTPKGIAIAAVSEDGFIADSFGDQSLLTSAVDRYHLREQIKRADTLLIGHNTYQEHAHKLGQYRCVILTHGVSSLRDGGNNHFYWNPAGMGFSTLCERLNIQNLCVLGGGETYSWARREGVLNELILTKATGRFLNGGITLFDDVDPSRLWKQLDNGTLGYSLSEEPKVLDAKQPVAHERLSSVHEQEEFSLELRKYRIDSN